MLRDLPGSKRVSAKTETTVTDLRTDVQAFSRRVLKRRYGITS
jgi:hypothetical protein